MNRLRSFLALAILTLALSADAQTASPTVIPFQGRLTDQAGTPYTAGQYTLTFNLYNEAVGGTTVWTERHEKVGVINGSVNVFLGSIQSITAVDFSTVKYLGITIDADSNLLTADPEMVPRQMIIPAFWAKRAEQMTFLRANGSVGARGWDAVFEGGDPDAGVLKLSDNSVLPRALSPRPVRQSVGNSVGDIVEMDLTDWDIYSEASYWLTESNGGQLSFTSRGGAVLIIVGHRSLHRAAGLVAPLAGFFSDDYPKDGYLELYSGSSMIAQQEVRFPVGTPEFQSWTVVDRPSAGPVSYKLRLRAGGGATLRVRELKITVFEIL